MVPGLSGSGGWGGLSWYTTGKQSGWYRAPPTRSHGRSSLVPATLRSCHISSMCFRCSSMAIVVLYPDRRVVENKHSTEIGA